MNPASTSVDPVIASIRPAQVRAMKLQDLLAYPPRLMDTNHAAAYCCMSKSKFLELVGADVFPAPKDLAGLLRWDRKDLDAACDGLDYRNRAPSGRKSLDELLKIEEDQRGND